MQKIFEPVYLLGLKIFKYNKFIKQKDQSDCGAACLATAANLYNISYPISIIREVAGTNQKGTSAYGLIKAAEEIGFDAKGVKADISDLDNKLKVPIIAHTIENNIAHYIVIYKIFKSNLVIFDPEYGLKVIDKQDFKEKWTNLLILLSPRIKESKVDIQKTKSSFIKEQINKNKTLLFQIFIASLFYTGFGIVGSFYFKYLIDQILVNGLQKTLHIISTAALLLTILKVVMDTFRNHLTLYLSQKVDISLIANYIEHILTLPLSFFERREMGEILSRIQDAGKIREAISGAAVTIMIDSLLIIAGGLILYLQSNFLFKIAVLLMPAYLFLVLLFNQRHKRVRKKEMKKGANLQSSLVELVRGINTVKSFNNEKGIYIKNEKNLIDFIEQVFRANFLKNIQGSFDNLLAAAGEIIILWSGGYQVINGNLTVGELITFNALLAYFYKPLQNLIKLQPEIQKASAAFDRLEEIMVLSPKEQDESLIDFKTFNKMIEYENVEFIYDMEHKVLNNLSFEIKKGEKVALVGKSGSGKTTIIKLLMKYYSNYKGNITIDGQNIEDLNARDLRDCIGYVPQDPYIFNCSIRENININQKDYSLKEIISVCKKSQIDSYINKLPLRYNTILNENGNNLSGGQRQRIAIARALLKNPEIIIFDEATNHLDYQTERDIYNMVENLTNDKTVIIIAHRLKSIVNCDRILYIDQGRVTESGSHKQLLAEKGQYFHLWQDQTNY